MGIHWQDLFQKVLQLVLAIRHVIGVPIMLFTGLVTSCCIVLSFWPVFLVLIPLFFGMFFLTATVIVLVLVVSPAARRRAITFASDFLPAWFMFLLPFHGVFVLGVVATFSVAWSLVVAGGLLFVFPRVAFRGKSGASGTVASKIRGTGLIDERLVNLLSPLLICVRDYFPITLHHADYIDANSGGGGVAADFDGSMRPATTAKPRLIAFHPHGVYSFGLFSAVFPSVFGWGSKCFGDRAVLIGIANSMLSMPFAGPLLSRLGFVPADAQSLRTACKSESDVAIVPGGVAEMLMGDDDAEVLYLRERKGFIRLALETGRDIVPVYSFGESKTFVVYGIARGLRMMLSRRLGVALQVFRGRWFTVIPFSTPIDVVVGAPVCVADVATMKGENGLELTQEARVHILHERYVHALSQLYMKNRCRFPGYENRKLVVT